MASDLDSESLPTLKLYSISGIRIATFVGFLFAGAVLISRNYSRLGNSRAAFISILLGTFGLLLLVVAAVYIEVPEEYDRPLLLIYGVLVLVVSDIAKRLQGEALSLHEEKGGQFHGTWRTLGISFIIAPVAVFLVIGTYNFLSEPEVKDIEVLITSPEVVKVGEPFKIRFDVRNEAAYEQELSTIWIADEYLQGIVIESSDPPFLFQLPLFGSTVYNYALPIPRGQNIEITLSAHGKALGEYNGQFEVFIAKTNSYVFLAETSVVSVLADCYEDSDKAVDKGNMDEAITILTGCLEDRSANRATTYLMRGIVYSFKQQNDRAIQDFTRAIELDSKNANFYYFRGLSNTEKENYDRAIQDFTRAIELDLKNVDSSISAHTKLLGAGEVYFVRGDNYRKKGLYDLARRDYQLAANQGHIGAQVNLGVMYHKGDGVEDFIQAYIWLNIAAASGDQIAKKNKEILKKKMTPQDISKAQALSREWIDSH